MNNILSSLRLLVALGLSIVCISGFAQQRYTITPDPKSPGRRIITLNPVRQRASLVEQKQNALDAEAAYRRPAIPFKPFEMINPRTKKPIKPDAKFTLTLPNGRKRNFTAKQFFDELNELEKQLCLRGHSLRLKDAFTGMRVVPVSIPPGKTPGMNVGFVNKSIRFDKPVSEGKGKQPTGPVIPIKPVTAASVDFTKVNLAAWDATLYIAETTSDHGTTEFPVVWVPASLANKGRNKFPLLIQVPNGFEKLVTKAVWQVSEKPFDNTLKNYSADVIVSDVYNTLNWSKAYRGVDMIKDNGKYMFAGVTVNMSSIPEPVDDVKVYYTRVLLYNASGEMIKSSSVAGLAYGGKPGKIYVPLVNNNTVPGFGYSFPSSPDIPFGLFVRGGGLNSKKIETGSDNGVIPIGYRISADAQLGFRYFNFLSLVDNAEPKSKELSVLRGTFTAIAGKSTSPSNQDEKEGVNLAIDVLEGFYKENIPLTETLPGTGISLNYSVKQSLDKEVLNTRFFIGPVPVRISAGFGGEAGLEMSGTANLATKSVYGSIKPYLNSTFTASGGVDAIIAYATLNAKLDPLLSISLPVTFNSSSATGLSFEGSLKALYGKVYLKVGFYYPCPDLEKIIGWLSGDEEVPLCECNWEYNIFDFPGYEHRWTY